MGTNRTYFERTGSSSENRTQADCPATSHGWDHLSDANWLPVECPAARIRRRQLGASDLPTLDWRGRPGSPLGPAGGRMRGIGRSRLAVASRRWRDGQSPFWGGEIGPNPTDRGKKGVKRSVLVEADGGPLAVVIAGANVPDTKLLDSTIEAIVVERPEPTPEQPQNMSLDKG